MLLLQLNEFVIYEGYDNGALKSFVASDTKLTFNGFSQVEFTWSTALKMAVKMTCVDQKKAVIFLHDNTSHTVRSTQEKIQELKRELSPYFLYSPEGNLNTIITGSVSRPFTPWENSNISIESKST